MKSLLSAAPLALFSILLAISARGQQEHITSQWIDTYNNGDTDKYWVTRGEQKLPIHPLMCLEPGDTIDFANPTDWVRLHLEKQSNFYVCEQNTAGHPCDAKPPFKVPAAKTTLTVSARITGWLGATLADWINSHQNTNPQDAEPSRGGSIFVPLLTAVPNRLVEGHRKICLGWSGGSHTYRLRIMNEATDARLLDADLPAQSPWCSQELDLKQGIYRVTLSNGDDTLDGQFFAIGEKEVPQIPQDNLSGLDNDLRQTVEAAWLAGQGDGIWAWEAYARVVPLAPTYRPAEVLCKLLQNGKLPAPPQN